MSQILRCDWGGFGKYHHQSARRPGCAAQPVQCWVHPHWSQSGERPARPEGDLRAKKKTKQKNPLGVKFVLWSEILQENPVNVISVSPSGHQLIHSSVVDTSVVFPHRLGLPYKRALRNLMADHLKRIIQDNGETMSRFREINFIFGVSGIYYKNAPQKYIQTLTAWLWQINYRNLLYLFFIMSDGLFDLDYLWT